MHQIRQKIHDLNKKLFFAVDQSGRNLAFKIILGISALQALVVVIIFIFLFSEKFAEHPIFLSVIVLLLFTIIFITINFIKGGIIFFALKIFNIRSSIKTLAAGSSIYTIVFVILLIFNGILASLFGITAYDINIARLFIDSSNDGTFLLKLAVAISGVGFLINILLDTIMLQDFYDTKLKKTVVASFIVEFVISALLSFPLKP